MSWFNNIPVDKWGTKQKKIQLTNKVKKIKRESKKGRAHTMKDVKKNRQVLDQQAAIKIKNIQDIIIKFGIVDNTNLLAAKAVQSHLFDNTFTARIFIQNFKDKIFSS